MLMAAVAYNLKKLMKFTTNKAQAEVKALRKSLQNTFSILTAIIMRYEVICQLLFLKVA
jgi:hypothetical protein